MFSAIPDGLGTFIKEDFPSSHFLHACDRGLAGIQPTYYDCCINSHICYAVPYRDLDRCPECNEPHFSGQDCQEIGLVAVMFFFELLFSYFSLAISFYVFFLELILNHSFSYLLLTWD